MKKLAIVSTLPNWSEIIDPAHTAVLVIDQQN